MSGETSEQPDGDRLTAVELRLNRVEGHRDGLLVAAIAVSAVAVIAAIVGVGLGARAIDETKRNVNARGAAAPAAAPSRPCRQAGGFQAGAQVQDRGTKPATGTTAAIEAGDFFFSPTCTSPTPAGTVTLTVHNTGHALHNVSIADQNIDQDIQPGQTITVQVKVGASPVQYVCKYHRTSGMVGALVPADT